MKSKGKNSGPFLRGQRGVYYCWVDGRLRSLRTKKPKIAEANYRTMLTTWKDEIARESEPVAPAIPTVRECFNFYLERAGDFEPNTVRNRRSLFDDFCSAVGDMPCPKLTSDHLIRWMDSHPNWSSSTKRSHINSIMAAFNHCVRRRKIAENPLFGLVKPRWERRSKVISGEDQAVLLAAAKGPFRLILFALVETGARPSELCRANVSDYKDGTIVLLEHKEDDRVDERIIYLTDAVKADAERLIGDRTKGPIWRNTYGNRWTPDSIYCRFKRLRKDLGLSEGVFPYSTRHRFASDAINDANANPAVLAKLLGHADTSILMKHYYRENSEAARKAIEEIRRKKPEPPPAHNS